jgi:DNA processing protein
MIQLARRDPRYPERLRGLSSAPDPLWVWGDLPDPSIPTVGIVGTRRLTTYGARIARELATVLARAGAVIVSGLAQGIDSTAHGGALDAKGRTIAVLGEGLAYFDDHGPLRRRQLAQRIRRQGALVSEYPLDLPAAKWTFPQRNATIAGLSDALVVVEAPVGSGALITAEAMADLGRPVFAVPGPFGAPTWIGSHRSIAQGQAEILTSADQVASEVGLRLVHVGPAGRNPVAEWLLALLATEAVDMDAIVDRLAITPTEAAMLVAEQMIAGAIAPTGDGRFARR